MIKITREIFTDLLSWKASPSRKPLLLRGPRQVGKTFIVRELGQAFPNFIELNLLDNKDLHAVFQRKTFNIDQMLSEIAGYFSKQIIDGETLLFLDEIQACPEAIESLRFFYEKQPHLHVIATGSLLEFALTHIPSFGVGRIDNLFIHPLTFREFLVAKNKSGLLERIQNATPKAPMPEVLHQAAIQEYKIFLLIGGMPEAVASFLETNSYTTTLELLENIIIGYEDDFQKYRKRIPSERLRAVLRSSALQTGKKFVYKHSYLDANSQAVNEALSLLIMAGIVNKVHHSSCNGIPIGADIDLKKFKTLPVDIGIYQRLVGLKIQDLILTDPAQLIHKGPLVEAAVGLELIGYSSRKLRPELFYWHREAKSSNAELDYVIEIDGEVTPIEVKSGNKGAMQSLRLFLDQKKKKFGIRVSFENFSTYEDIVVLPVYAVGEIKRIAKEV